MLEIKRHGLILKQLLRQIFQDGNLAGRLAFKGGTCLYLFHNLPRFSVDLDFDLLAAAIDFQVDKLTDLFGKSFKIVDQHAKRQTFFWLLSYQNGMQKIKIEVNRRFFSPNQYQPLDFLGITVPVMTPECMLSHKLCAITDRNLIQNRDLFDSHFMLTQNWEPEPEIIKLRTNLAVEDYYQQLIAFINQEVSSTKILDGLGQLLTNDQQRNWVKTNLIQELTAQLQMRF